MVGKRSGVVLVTELWGLIINKFGWWHSCCTFLWLVCNASSSISFLSFTHSLFFHSFKLELSYLITFIDSSFHASVVEHVHTVLLRETHSLDLFKISPIIVFVYNGFLAVKTMVGIPFFFFFFMYGLAIYLNFL